MPFVTSRSLAIAIAVIGVSLRLWQYAANTSLYVDEVMLADNVLERPLNRLILTPLDFNQVAPKGFLVVEKALMGLFYDTDYLDAGLRLFPVVCAVISLILFYRLAELTLSCFALPLAVLIFAIKPTFILYGSFVKQYSTDTTASLLIMLMALELRIRGVTWRRCFMIGALGCIVAQFSQAAVLVLVSVGIALLLLALAKREWKSLSSLGVLLVLWAIGAATAVISALRSVTPATYTYLRVFWQDGFMPALSPHGGNNVLWLWNKFYDLFASDASYASAIVYMGLTALGTWSFWRRRREIALITLAPVAGTLVAAVAHQYPFSGRLIMFLIPSLLIVSAEGAECVSRMFPNRVAVGKAMLLALFAVPPIYDIVTHPPVYRFEDIKPMLAYLRAQKLPDDAVYVYYGASQALSFYSKRYRIDDGNYIIGGCYRGNRRAYLRELDQFRGRPRVWVLFSHELTWLQERAAMISYLDRIGVRLDSRAVLNHIWWQTPPEADVHAYLYELSHPVRLAATSAETHVLPTAPMPGPAFECRTGGAAGRKL